MGVQVRAPRPRGNSGFFEPVAQLRNRTPRRRQTLQKQAFPGVCAPFEVSTLLHPRNTRCRLASVQNLRLRAELARELGISRATMTRLCQGPLAPAMVDGLLVDVTHPTVVRYRQFLTLRAWLFGA